MGFRDDPTAMARLQPIAYADNRNTVEHAGFSDEFWKYQENVMPDAGHESDDPVLFLIQCEDEDQRAGLEIGTTYQNWLTAL